MKRSCTCLFSAAALAFLCATHPAIASDSVGQSRLKIKAQPLTSALLDFSEQTGLQIGFAAYLVNGKETQGVEDIDDPAVLLDQLLANTGLRYQFVNRKTVVIRTAASAREAGRRVSRNFQPVRELIMTAQPQEQTGQVEQQSDDGGDDTDEDADEDSPLELQSQVVTGSRLIGGDPSARVYSFTAEEIAKRGVSNLEEFFRTVPWAFSTINSQTGMGDGNEAAQRGDPIIFPGGIDVGVASANLRGLGSANTLVLRNGRRIAGVGGQEADFVNLLDVPLSAIERIEIQLDGASAVYGSDAIGGVINFITKKNYSGVAVDLRQELSSSDAHAMRASITAGYAWGSGNVTALLTHSSSDPITNAKTGWTSLDLRPLLGFDFDRRQRDQGQPGVACALKKHPPWDPKWPPNHSCFTPFIPGVPFVWEPPVYYQLPPDHSGANAQVSDFNTSATGGAVFDEVAPQNGEDGSRRSVNVSVEQYLTDSLRIYAELTWSESDSYQEYDRHVQGSFQVPASNAYNPFGVPMQVGYSPIYEFENGALPPQHDRSDDESRTVNFGMYYEFGGSHELNVDVNRTKSWRESSGFRVQPNITPLDPRATAFYEALASSDPDRALNVFGNGMAQGSSFEEFIAPQHGPDYGVTETRQYSLTLRGRLFRIWGGPITYSAGGEYRENIIFQEFTPTLWLEGVHEEWRPAMGSIGAVGVERPSRDATAYYAEFAFPLFGPDNAKRGLYSLTLTAQARYDIHEAVGSFGGQTDRMILARNYYYDVFDGLTYGEGMFNLSEYSPKIATQRNSRLSPRLGIQYRLSRSFMFRAAWSRSYTSPTWTDQFDPQEPLESPFYRFTGPDPYAPGGPRVYQWADGIPARLLRYSPGIQPEYSTNWSAGFDWSPAVLPGFRMVVDWSAVDYTNRIAYSSSYLSQYPELLMNNPLIAERDQQGNLARVNHRNINIEERYSELASIHLEYAFDTSFGSFVPAVDYARYMDDFEQLVPEAPKDSALGTQNGQDRYKWQFSLNWQWRRYAADVFVYYTPGYLNDNAGNCLYSSAESVPEGSRCSGEFFETLTLDVPSLTTVDLTLSYQFDNGLRVRVGGRNALNRSAPPTVNGPSGTVPYDASRWDARGRVWVVDLNWQM